MNNDDLIDAIDIVRDALMTDEEEEQFQRIIDRLEGYELAYEVILSENERLEKQIDWLNDKIKAMKLFYSGTI
jgi:chaperonin cofactor prefoldin